MILVTGTLVAKPDSFDRLLELSLEHVHRSRSEPGCREHGVYRDTEEPMRLHFFEKWTDAKALEDHFALASSTDFVAAATSLVAEPPTLEVYDATRLR